MPNNDGDDWRICSEDPDATRYTTSDARRKREYERAKLVICADPLNRNKDRKRHRLTTPRWKARGRCCRFKVNSGWRFIYEIDEDSKCIHILHAGSHDEINALAFS